MHLLRKYDVAPVGRNDAMFAKHISEATSLGEAVIISDSDIICRRQTSLKKLLEKSQGVFSVSPVRKRTGEKPLILLGFAQFFLTN